MAKLSLWGFKVKDFFGDRYEKFAKKVAKLGNKSKAKKSKLRAARRRKALKQDGGW